MTPSQLLALMLKAPQPVVSQTAAPVKAVPAAPAITPFVEFRLQSNVATAANGREAAK